MGKHFLLSVIAIITLGLACIRCSILLGGDQKVENKSKNYTYLRLDKSPEQQWRILSHSQEQEKEDIAYEHNHTKIIISLNSVCRNYSDNTSLDLLSKNLLRGLYQKGERQNKEIEVDGVKALESTVDTVNPGNTIIRVRTVVLKKSNCTYDLLYISKPELFEKYLPDFDRFLKGFHAA